MKWQIFLSQLVKDNMCTSKYVGIPFLEEKKNILYLILSALISSIIAFFLKFENEILTYIILLIMTFIISLGISKIGKLENIFSITAYAYIAVLFAILSTNQFLDFLLYILGYHIGFLILYFLLDSLNHKLKRSQIPKCMEGLPITLITLSIIALLIGRYF